MLDFDALCVAIVSRVNSNVTALGGKIFYDFVPEQLPTGTKVTRPYCRFSLITDSPQSVYGHTFLDNLGLQFSIFANDLATANSICKSIKTAFHGQQLSLTAGTNVSCRRIPGDRVLVQETQEGIVYHALTMIEFRVQS
jgi:hypothetical protein